MGHTPVPKFTYPGDDPELDRLLNEARIDGENDLTSYPDVFGRRKVRTKPVLAAKVDQDAVTIPPGSPWVDKGAKIDKKALPSSLRQKTPAAPVLSTGPVVTEMPAAALPKRQALWLVLGALTIIGPVTIIVFHPTTGAQGTLLVPPSAASVAAMAAPPVSRGAPAPNVTAVPRIEEDAATPTAPAVDGGAYASAPIRRAVNPKPSTDDPYSEPPRKPDPGKLAPAPLMF